MSAPLSTRAVALLAQPSTAAIASAVLAIALLALRRRRRPLHPARVALALALGALCATGLWLALHRYDWSVFRGLVRFAQPRLLVVPALFALAALARVRRLPETLSRARGATAFALGALAVLCASIAVAGPEWGHPIDRLTVVLAVDHSRSLELVPNGAGREHDEETRAAAGMRSDDRIARVVFGAEAATEDPAHPRTAAASAQEVPVGVDATDLGAAIRRALAEVPDESAGRVVLLTDGAANRGDALGAAAAASAAGVPVDVVRLSPRVQRNVRVESVRVPVSAAEGEAFDLRLIARSSAATDVQVRVSVDGRVVQTGPARLHAGEDVLTLRQTAPSAGLHRYEVDITASDPALDAVVQDDRAGTFLRVRGPSSVLILEGEEGRSAPLAQALRAAAFRTEERGASGFPDDLAALAAYDLVVLSDVPARALSPEQMDQLATYVRDLGGGLLLMGGDRGMGPGGYSRTPVEEISPVLFDMRQERRRSSLTEVIAIDFSGSMAMTVPTGQTKLALANEAAARSALLLGPTDRLGVMHVDTEVHWTVPVQTVGTGASVASIVQRVRAVGPSGGGIIIPVTLTSSYAALQQANTNLRHLLLFSDGSDSEMIQGQAPVVAEAFARGITTSVVSLGRGGDTPELEHLSREGHGRFYLVEDATRLPAVFAQETMLAARSTIREEPFRPSVSTPDEVTRGIDFGAGPPLRGWVVTIPKPRAQVLLTGPDDDPILSRWQVGVGRVAAFASDAKDRWGADWLAWPEAPRLWAELARSLVRRGDPLVRVEADTAGGVLHVHADARTADGYADSLRRLTARITGPDGATRELALDPVGAGTYGAELPLDRPGAFAVAVRDDALGAVVASGGAILLEGEELRPASDPQLLERIAAMTGGRVRPTLASVFDDRVGLRRAYTPLGPQLLLAAAALLFLALAARRLALPEALVRALEGRSARGAASKSAGATGTVAALLARKQQGASGEGARAAARDEREEPSRGARAPVFVASAPPTRAPPASAPVAKGANAAASTEPAAKPSVPEPRESGPRGTGSLSLDALLAKKRARR